MRENEDEGVSKKASAWMGVGAESYMDKKKNCKRKWGLTLCGCSEWNGVCAVRGKNMGIGLCGSWEMRRKKMEERMGSCVCGGVGGWKEKIKMGKKKWRVDRPRGSGVGVVAGRGSVWRGNGKKMGASQME